jgi:hypothetical protein
MLDNEILSQGPRPDSGKIMNAAFREDKRKSMNQTAYDIA